MWSLIENKASVIALYKEMLPQFQNVTIQEMTVVTGENMGLNIRFDTHELPKLLPVKWEKQNVNTIQFVISCVEVKFRHFDINENFMKMMTINVDMVDTNKCLTIQKNDGSIGVQIEASWIYVRSVTGYCSTSI